MMNLIILKISHIMNNSFNLFCNLLVNLTLTIFSAHKGKFGAIIKIRIVIILDHIYAINEANRFKRLFIMLQNESFGAKIE